MFLKCECSLFEEIIAVSYIFSMHRSLCIKVVQQYIGKLKNIFYLNCIRHWHVVA